MKFLEKEEKIFAVAQTKLIVKLTYNEFIDEVVPLYKTMITELLELPAKCHPKRPPECCCNSFKEEGTSVLNIINTINKLNKDEFINKAKHMEDLRYVYSTPHMDISKVCKFFKGRKEDAVLLNKIEKKQRDYYYYECQIEQDEVNAISIKEMS